MTPMIDVVFLLIVFFLVSSHLARQESQMSLPLPAADTGEELDVQAAQVVINVLPSGVVLLAGRQVSGEDLQRRLRNELQRSGPNLAVRIRSDRGVAYRVIQPILLAVSRAGIGDVTFAVVKRGSAN